MNKLIKYAFYALIGVTCLVLLTQALGEDNKEQRETITPTPTITVAPTNTPIATPTPMATPTIVNKETSIMRESFMDGCMEDNPAQYDYCDCTFNKMLNGLGRSGFLEFAIEYDETGIIPEWGFDVFMDAIDSCYHLSVEKNG